VSSDSASTAPLPRTNLPPAERTRFFGREAELGALRSLQAAGDALISVVGPPGMGKSRLARQFARWLLSATDCHVFWCDLGAARNLDALLAAVAGALGAPLSRGRHLDAAEALGRAIAARGPLVLVLDGFENLVPHASRAVGGWLEQAPSTQLLVTSQVRLGVEGETCLELTPLAHADAVALYEDRAGRSRGDLQAPDPASVEELVVRLDHLPLAIELAAARAAVLSPGKLLARLDRRLELLRGPLPGRHASLASAIACSFDLLAPVERRGLAQVSVFRGSFSVEAAEEMLAPVVGTTPGLDVLESLRERSLLHRDEAHPERLALYESIRDFAWQKLEQTGDTAAALERYHACCLRRGEELVARIPTGDGVAALRELQIERPNLLAAFQGTERERPEVAARLGLALVPLAARRGPAAFEADLLDRTVAAARRSGDTLLLARALRARGFAHLRHGYGAESRRDLDEGLALARRHGDVVLEARLLGASGRLASIQGDIARGREELRRALSLLEGRGDPVDEAEVLNHLGAVEENAGRPEVAGPLFAAALERSRASGDLRFEGICTLNLGVVRSSEGRQEDARDLYETALALLERADDRAGAADALVDLGCVLVIIGELDEAERHLERALALEQACGNRWFEALALGHLGLVAQQRGELRLARQRYQRALAAFEACGERRFHGLFRAFFAAAEASLGLADEARSDLAAARRVFAELDDAGHLATVDLLEGFLDLDQARRAAERFDLPAANAAVAAARRRLEAAPPPGGHASEVAIARRLLGRALAERELPEGTPRPELPPETQLDALVVAPDASWFEPPGGGRVDIARRGPLRLVLQGLVEQRLLAPGVGLTSGRVFELGWPGERALPAAAANRVYAAIRTLRALGLDGLLKRHGDGYLLEPTVRVVRAR
jgi:predicted ATPase/Tfp pilus assembly protein PilF